MADHDGPCWAVYDERADPEDGTETLIQDHRLAILATCGHEPPWDWPINWSMADGGWQKVNLDTGVVRRYSYRRLQQPPCGCCSDRELEIVSVEEVAPPAVAE